MNLTDDAKRLLKLRYCRDNEQPEDVYPRIAKALGKHNGNEKDFLMLMEENRFLPNSPCLRNAGFSNVMSACFVLGIEDSMDSIFSTLRSAALIYQQGGGVGINFSDLREEGAPLSSGGQSSGVMSFLKIFDSITDAVKQGGFRRGAGLAALNVDHPEIYNYIKAKVVPNTYSNFNFSVLINNEFMKKVEEDEILYLRSPLDRRKITNKVKCRDLFSAMSFAAWMCGDPGLLFFDRINQDNIYYNEGKGEAIICSNPCGEVPLLSGENCTLGSINLATHVENGDINWDKFKESVEIGTKFLMAIKKYNEFPFDLLYKMNAKTQRQGLGIMGYADALIELHIKYDSNEALKLIEKIGSVMKPVAKRLAPMAASVLSIAPTGSLSILAGCSASIEPIYSRDFERRVVAGTFKESREDSEYLRTAHEISPEWHVKVQAAFQSFVDAGVSKTVNAPYDVSSQDIYDIYKLAYESGCKGVTVFRDRSKDTQVYYNTTPKCEGEVCYL